MGLAGPQSQSLAEEEDVRSLPSSAEVPVPYAIDELICTPRSSTREESGSEAHGSDRTPAHPIRELDSSLGELDTSLESRLGELDD